MELFDVIDSKSNQLDKVHIKEKAHAENPHRTAHIWIIRKKRAECRFFYRNAHKTRILFGNLMILPR